MNQHQLIREITDMEEEMRQLKQGYSDALADADRIVEAAYEAVKRMEDAVKALKKRNEAADECIQAMMNGTPHGHTIAYAKYCEAKRETPRLDSITRFPDSESYAARCAGKDITLRRAGR